MSEFWILTFELWLVFLFSIFGNDFIVIQSGPCGSELRSIDVLTFLYVDIDLNYLLSFPKDMKENEKKCVKKCIFNIMRFYVEPKYLIALGIFFCVHMY